MHSKVELLARVISALFGPAIAGFQQMPACAHVQA